MIIGHTMMRFLHNFQPYERSKHLEVLMTRLHKMIIGHARKYPKEGAFTSEFEKILWKRATDAYTMGTPVLGIDFCAIIHSYYPVPFKKYGNITEKLMLQVQGAADMSHIPSEEYRELENHGDDIATVYIKQLEPHTNISIRKSAFAGKKSILVNNMIIEGVKVKDGF